MKARKLKKLLGLMLAVTLVLPTSQMTVSAKPDPDPQGGSGNRQMAESAAVASQENRESGLVGFQGEYAVSEGDTPVSVIVEFVHQPAELVEAIAEANEEEVDESTKELNALAKKDKEDFYKALEGVNYTVKYEYSLGMNGVAVTVPQSMVDDIAQMECVFAVYPDETHVNVIEPEGDYEEEEIAPQSADQFQVFSDTSRESSDAVVEPKDQSADQAADSTEEDQNAQDDTVSGEETSEDEPKDEDINADASEDSNEETDENEDADSDEPAGDEPAKEDPEDVTGPADQNQDPAAEGEDTNMAATQEQIQAIADVTDPNAYVQGMEESVKFLKVDELNKQGLTGEGVTVGVIDTGIDYEHPDLANTFSAKLPNGNAPKSEELLNGKFIGRNYIKDNGRKANDPMDDQGHGTHVSGTVAARGENTSNVKTVGVAPRATLVSYKVINAKDSCTDTDVNMAMEDAVKDGCDIISMSLGWSGANNATHTTTLMLNSLALVDKDALFVVCAGNSGSKSYTIWSPGTSPLALTVANARIESENRLLTVNRDGNETPLRLIRSGWGDKVVENNGKYTVGSLRADADGKYKMVLLPTVDGKNLGTGTQEEFDAFAGKVKAEDYAGALFVVSRGQSFDSLVPRIRKAFGTGAVAVLNTKEREDDFEGISWWQACYNNYLPVFTAQYDVGQALVKGLTVGQAYSFDFSKAEPLHSSAAEDIGCYPAADTSIGPVKDTYDAKPDLAAPGTAIISTSWRNYIGVQDYEYSYVAMNGTSMATPHVSGIAALLRQKNPKLTAIDIKSALVSTSDRTLFSDKISRLAVGAGMVDPVKAVQAIDDLVVMTAQNKQAFTSKNNEFVSNTIQTPTISFGMIPRGETEREIEVTVENKGKKSHTYNVGFENMSYTPDNSSTAASAAGNIFTASEKTITVAAGSSAKFTVKTNLKADTATGAYETTVVLTDGSQRVISPAAAYVYEEKPSDPIIENPVDHDLTFIHTAAMSTGEYMQLRDYGWLGSDRTMLQFKFLDPTMDTWQPLLYKDGQLVGSLGGANEVDRKWLQDWWYDTIVLTNFTPCRLEEDGTIVTTGDTAPITEEGAYKLALLFKKKGTSHRVVEIADIYIDNTLPEIKLARGDDQNNWKGVIEGENVIYSGNVFDAGTKDMQDRGINSAVNERIFGKTTSQSDNVIVAEIGNEFYRAEIDENGDFRLSVPTAKADGAAKIYYGDHFDALGISQEKIPDWFSEGFTPYDMSYAQWKQADNVPSMNLYGFRAANMGSFDVKLAKVTPEAAAKSDLQELIDDLKQKLEMTDVYTAESLAKLTEALTAAEALMANGNASLEELYAQIEALKNVDSEMEVKPDVPVDPEDPTKPTDPSKPTNPTNPEEPVKPVKPGTNQTTSGTTNKNTSSSVNTGDHNPIVLCLVMILMSLIAMEVCVAYKRRRHLRK